MSRTFWIGPVFVSTAFHAVVLMSYLAAFQWDLSALVCVGSERIGHWPYERITVGFPADGFDGQYYYALSRDPWRTYEESTIIAPAYRHARILYPTMVWCLSFGHSPFILVWMPVINLICIGLITRIGSQLAVHYERSAWWGVLLPLALNTGMSTLRNLTEPLATATLVGLIAAWIIRRPLWQLGLWALLSMLSREQNVLIVAIVGLETLMVRQWSRAFALILAGMFWAFWILVLHSMYDQWPTAESNTGYPFQGMYYRWTHLAGLTGAISIPLHILGMLVLSVQVVLSFSIPFRGATRLATLIALAGALLAIVGGEGIYQNGWSYSRVFLWMPLGIWLWGCQSGRRWPMVILCIVSFWQVAAVPQAWKMRNEIVYRP